MLGSRNIAPFRWRVWYESRRVGTAGLELVRDPKDGELDPLPEGRRSKAEFERGSPIACGSVGRFFAKTGRLPGEGVRIFGSKVTFR